MGKRISELHEAIFPIKPTHSADQGRYDFVYNPKPNFYLSLGDCGKAVFAFNVEKSLKNRIKYWLLCRVFPFTIDRWEGNSDAEEDGY